MIQAGKNITNTGDPLMKIKVEYLFHKLIQPDAEIAARIRQLRIVRELDPKQYSLLKKQLPYVVCGIFNPPVRKTENFGYTEYFIVDIDHISDKQLEISDIRRKICADERAMLCFASPGQDGLKVLFKLNERCYDAGIYSLFYKLFVQQFALQYGLQQVVDVRTSDVARACFISMDNEAYYNPSATTVDISAFIDANNVSELFRQKKQVESDMAKQQSTLPPKGDTNVPDDAALQHIRSLLNPNGRKVVSKQEAYIPEELNLLMDKLIPYLEEAKTGIVSAENISYGKKLKFKTGFREAEINVFYGKKGYSVVISPRKGTNNELNSLMAELIEQFLTTSTE